MIELFPDQLAVVATLRDTMRRVRTPLLCSATGSGKTVMFSYITSRAAAAGKRVTIGVHRGEIVEQISRTLARFKVPHGIICAGYVPDYRPLVQVASVPTLVRRLGVVPAPDLLIADEAHHCTPASAWGTVLAHYARARVLGVTATPERLDGQGLRDCFEDLVIGPQTHDLIPAGRLCDYALFGPERGSGIDLSQFRKRGGDYAPEELQAAIDRPTITGDAIAEYQRLCPGVPAIVRGVSIIHSRHLAEAFNAAGFTAAHIDGTTERGERTRMVEAFRRGEIRVLCQVNLFDEGFDVPAVRAVLDLNPTESLTKARQFWGRALRVEPGKDVAYIIDHAGNWHRHGLPDSERAWSLEGRRKVKGERDPDDVAIRQCPACKCVNRATAIACRDCGTPFSLMVKSREVDVVEGSLVAVNRAAAEAAIDARRAQGMARTSGDLRALGVSDGRAAHILAARAEKDALRQSLLEVQQRLCLLNGEKPMPKYEIERMKPKALREAIDRASVTVRAILIDQRGTLLTSRAEEYYA